MRSPNRLWRDLRRLAVAEGCTGAGVPGALAEERVVAALEGLSERARLLVALRYFEGLGRSELAAALGLSETQIDAELAAAVSEIHAALRRTGEQRGVGSV